MTPQPPRRKVVLATGVIAGMLGATLAGIVAPVASVAQSRTVNTVIVDHKVIKPGGSLVVSLPVPAEATSVGLVVAGQLAWRATKISVCAGTTVTKACKASPALTTPVKKPGFAHLTVPVSDDRKIVVYNSSASVERHHPAG